MLLNHMEQMIPRIAARDAVGFVGIDHQLERLARVPLAGPIRRYGDSIVVPVTRGTGGPKIAFAGHLDVVRTVHDGPPRRDGGAATAPSAPRRQKRRQRT